VTQNGNPLPPPEGMEHGWKSELRMLVAKKHDRFPRLMRRIPRAEFRIDQVVGLDLALLSDTEPVH